MCVCVLVTQLCPTPCDPEDCSPSGSSVRGILQARTQEWMAIFFSRDETQVSCIAGGFFTICATREVQGLGILFKNLNVKPFDTVVLLEINLKEMLFIK